MKNRNVKLKYYLLESEIKYSKQERNAFLESLRQYGHFKNDVYRSKTLKEISEKIGNIISTAEGITLAETQEWFDEVSVSRDLKALKDDYKLFDKTCQEMTQLQQRLESLYEAIGTKLDKYYEF